MKKRILRSLVGLIILVAFLFPSCEFLENCATCKLASDNGTEITYGPPLIYCDEKLDEKINSEPVTIGNTTTYWVCE